MKPLQEMCLGPIHFQTDRDPGFGSSMSKIHLSVPIIVECISSFKRTVIQTGLPQSISKTMSSKPNLQSLTLYVES